ncbi:MAG: FAD binding domain-containing protein [Candidatus Neomarinimicrobiota bacterium]
MQENIKEWYRPGSVDEVLNIIRSDQGIPYAGGTGLKNSPVAGLIDLRRLNLNYINENSSGKMIGACTHFNEIANYTWPDSRRILGQAAGQAASNPLRNLITIGGSLAFRPVWSNVPTPLLALNASVKAVGAQADEYSITDFLQLKRSSKFFITEIDIPPAPGFGVYHRFARTRFDYSALDLAVYIEVQSGAIVLCRIAIGNAIPVAIRLINVENRLTGLSINDSQIPAIINAVEIKPGHNPNFSREFLLNMLRTELLRAFTKIREQVDAN